MNELLRKQADREYSRMLKARMPWFNGRIIVTKEMRDTLVYSWIALKISLMDFIKSLLKGIYE